MDIHSSIVHMLTVCSFRGDQSSPRDWNYSHGAVEHFSRLTEHLQTPRSDACVRYIKRIIPREIEEASYPQQSIPTSKLKALQKTTRPNVCSTSKRQDEVHHRLHDEAILQEKRCSLERRRPTQSQWRRCIQWSSTTPQLAAETKYARMVVCSPWLRCLNQNAYIRAGTVVVATTPTTLH